MKVTHSLSSSQRGEILRPLAEVLDRATRGDRHLVPTARWLFTQSQAAAAAIDRAEPSIQELASLRQLVEENPAYARPLLRRLFDYAAASRSLALEIQLEALMAAKEDWQHPARVLIRPDVEALLDVAESRLAASETSEERDRVEGVLKKLQRAVRIRRAAKNRQITKIYRERSAAAKNNSS